MEKYLIESCAPTLASLKMGSLFSMPCREANELEEQLVYWNRQMEPKGIRLLLMKLSRGRALIYVCRISGLLRELKTEPVQNFLEHYGYGGMNPARAVEHLKDRLSCSDEFPHEVGIFLGYPLEDVKDFIENKGQNYKCAGCWKVYCDECQARRTFEKFRKCREVYTRLWRQGRSVLQLTVAA